MSVLVMGLVWESDVKAGRYVLLALADNANDGGYCMPGVAYLAGKTTLSRATVFRALEALEAEGFIQRRSRTRANGSRRSNAYRINLELLARRKRAPHPEEASELAALFDEDDVAAGPGPSQNETGVSRSSDSPPSQNETGVGSHSETGVVSKRDGGGLETRPLEPSLEPSIEPRGGRAGAHAREVASPSPPPPDSSKADPEPSYDPGHPRCREHRSVPVGERGPNCSACAQAREWQEHRDAQAVAAAAAALRACPMCDAEGQRVDDRKVPLSPYRTCDHTTSSEAVLAAIRAAESTAPSRPAPGPPVGYSSESVKCAALTDIRTALSNRPVTDSNTGEDFRNTGGIGHTAGVHIRTG